MSPVCLVGADTAYQRRRRGRKGLAAGVLAAGAGL